MEAIARKISTLAAAIVLTALGVLAMGAPQAWADESYASGSPSQLEAQEGDIASGTWGDEPTSSRWEISSEGVLTVHPGQIDLNKPKPWSQHQGYIKEIVFAYEGTSKITLSGQSLCGFFVGADRVRVIDLAGLDTTSVTDMSSMFSGCWSLVSVHNLSSLDTSSVTDMDSMFSGCSSLELLDVSGFDTSRVTDMSEMFYNCSSLESLDVSGWNTSKATDMSSMFYGCSSLKPLNVSGFKTSLVTDMGGMFYECSSLASLNVSGFDTSRVTNMSSMFSYCSSLASLDVSGFDTSRVTNMSAMFYHCSSLKSLGVSGWDTKFVQDMGLLFYGCSSLTSIDLSRWKTSWTTNMSSMFGGCASLTSLDLSGFDTSWVKDMGGMFHGCSSLSSLDVSGWDTSSVTRMSSMFSECTSLTSLDLSDFDTQRVTDMNSMLYSCSELSSLDLSEWNTSGVEDMEYMFHGCSKLASLNMSGWDTSSATSVDGMFQACTSLASLDLSGWDTSSVTDVDSMFSQCSSLGSISVGAKTTKLGEMPSYRYWISDKEGVPLTSDEVIQRLSLGIADTFTKKIALEDYADASLDKYTYEYTGSAINPEPSVTCNGKTLVKGRDYVLICDENVGPGEAWVHVEGIGEYAGRIDIEFEIVMPTSIDGAVVVLSQAGFAHDGDMHRPEVQLVVVDGYILAEGADYDVTYPADCTSVGEKTITVTGKGAYTGVATATYQIFVPQGEKGERGPSGSSGSNGRDGKDGNGIESVEKTSSDGLVDTYTITLTNGETATFTVTNGKDGANGKDGKDGKNGKDASEPSVEMRVKDGMIQYRVGDDGVWKNLVEAPDPIGTEFTVASSSGESTYVVTGEASVTLTKFSGTKYSASTVKHGSSSYRVTEVASRAFAKSGTKSVALGKYVKSIGASAFAKCKNLKKLIVESKVLTKDGVKNCLKDSSVKMVRVPKAKLAAYSKLFTKAMCGKNVKVVSI